MHICCLPFAGAYSSQLRSRSWGSQRLLPRTQHRHCLFSGGFRIHGVLAYMPLMHTDRHVCTSWIFLFSSFLFWQETKLLSAEKLTRDIACVDGFESVWAISREKKGYSGIVKARPSCHAMCFFPCLYVISDMYCRDCQLCMHRMVPCQR